MAVRLVRESSDTPSITNKDDTKMIRYAYGDQNGYVINYGSEISFTSSGKEIQIGSGRIVLQGWEIDIDESGWIIPISITTGTQYYIVYAEVNLVTESASIQSTYGTASYPAFNAGDDLTKTPTGTARILIGRVIVINGVINSIEKIIKAVEYPKTLVERLSNQIQSGNIKAGQALKINNLPIAKEENTDKIGISTLEVIIPTIKVLYEDSTGIEVDGAAPGLTGAGTKIFSDEVPVKDRWYEIHIYVGGLVEKLPSMQTITVHISDGVVSAASILGTVENPDAFVGSFNSNMLAPMLFRVWSDGNDLRAQVSGENGARSSCYVRRIYEIIR